MKRPIYKRFLFLVLGCFWGISAAFAQDPHYTQLFNNRLFVNPAFCGVDKGLRVNSVHRNLWRSVAGKSYHTTGVALERQSCRFPKIGLGLLAQRDVEGEGKLTVTNFAFIFAYKTPLGRRGKSSLSFALQSDYYSVFVDWDKLVFSDQLDPIFGNVRPSSNANSHIENKGFPDFAMGGLFRNSWRRPSKEIFWHLGGAWHHITKPDAGGLLNKNPLRSKVTLHGGMLIPIYKMGHNRNYHVLTYVRYTGQNYPAGRHTSLDFGVNLLNKYILGGISYKINPSRRANNANNGYVQNTDVFSLQVGFSSDLRPGMPFRLFYSYDFNWRGVSNGTAGAHELSLIIALPNSCSSSKGSIEKKDCLDYAKKGLQNIF